MRIHKVKVKNCKESLHTCIVLIAAGFHPVVVPNVGAFSDNEYNILFLHPVNEEGKEIELPKEIENKIVNTTTV